VFDVAFVVVVISVAVQAPTVAPLTRRLDLVADDPKVFAADDRLLVVFPHGFDLPT
jgi:NhaP-type Na+/H+ and K+/H+ antiporter